MNMWGLAGGRLGGGAVTLLLAVQVLAVNSPEHGDRMTGGPGMT